MTWTPVIVAMVILCYTSLSDAEITVTAVGGLDDKGNLRCSSKVILMCMIQSYDGNMEWKVGGFTLMRCTSGACSTIPHKHYAFSFKGRIGQFNITINPVTFADNNVVFECNNGNVSQTLTTTVNVLPENSTTSLTVTNSTKTTENLEVKVTTGCVYPTEDVHFEWFYYKEGDDPVPFTFGDQSYGPSSNSTTDCSSGNCGGDDVKQMESTLTLKQASDGEDVFLQAVISSKTLDNLIVVRSNTSYKLNVPGMLVSSVIGSFGTKVGLIITLSLIGVFVLVVTIIIFVALASRGKHNPEKQRIVGNYN